MRNEKRNVSDPFGIDPFGITQFIGDYGNGLYRGTDAANHLHLTAGQGDDSFYAEGGNAVVSGGRGNDLIWRVPITKAGWRWRDCAHAINDGKRGIAS